MSFYPRLYEAEELPKGKFEKLMGKYVGASPANNIMIDPISRKIVHVNNKRRNDEIKDWNDILSFPRNHRDKLVKFVDDNSKLDVSSVLDDIKENAEKSKKEAKRKTPSGWKPKTIPPFPKGLKYGDFWDYQFEKHKDEIESNLKIKDDDRESSSSKTSSKVASAFATEYDIPEAVTQFYLENGKEKEWKSFLKNSTEGKGKSIVGELNDLFDLLNNILLGKVKPGKKYKVKKGLASVSLNNSAEIEEWKAEMLEYIGKYTTKTINEVNTDGTYQKMVPNKGTATLGFLGVLMNSEPSGMGRGEVLMAYMMQGARFAGGSESFDITASRDSEGDEPGGDIIADDITYELKDYSDSGGSIRLGAHGALTRFKWWKEMEKTVKLTRDLAEEIGEEKLKSILDGSDKHLYQVWQLIATDSPYQGNRNVGSAIDAGEVNVTKLAALKVFYGLMHEFLSKNIKSEKDVYSYAVLKGDGVKPKTIKIDPISGNEINDISDIKVSFDEKDLVKFKDFNSIKYVKDPLSLQIDLDSIGKHYSDTTDVDYFMVFMPDKMDIDQLEDFVFDTISQKAVKIKNIDRRSGDKAEQHADKTFKLWKDQNDKSYYEIYHDVLMDKSTNESFYPKLFN